MQELHYIKKIDLPRKKTVLTDSRVGKGGEEKLIKRLTGRGGGKVIT
jgi:hypothetical protein